MFSTRLPMTAICSSYDRQTPSVPPVGIVSENRTLLAERGQVHVTNRRYRQSSQLQFRASSLSGVTLLPLFRSNRSHSRATLMVSHPE